MTSKITAVLLILLIAAAASPFQQQETIPPELAYTDAQVDVLTLRLQTFQQEYHDLTGHYFQALQSNSTAPSVPVIPDGLSGSPTDQAEDLAFFWNADAALPEVLAWSFSISTYAGPDGDGYVLTISTSLEDVTWKKSVNFGPEDWRNSSWYAVVPFDFPY